MINILKKKNAPQEVEELEQPNPNSVLTSVGTFMKDGKQYEEMRQRLAAIGMSWFDECQSQRQQQERQWYLNLAFYTGNQYVAFKSVNGTFDLYLPSAPYYRVRMVINHIRKIVRKEISRLTAQKPNAYIIPASSEDTDVFAAQAGEQIWDSLWRRLHLNRVIRQAVYWQAVCGNGFIKSYWDPNKKDAEGKYGDVCIENVKPFYIFVPDLMEEDLEKQPYVIHAQVRSNSWVQETLGVDASNNRLESVDDQLLNVMQVQRNDKKKNQTTVLEIWVKPGYLPDLPEGGMFIIAAGQVVQGWDQWPYEHNQYPFSKLDGTLSGKFYNSSIIEDLIPLQRELNRSRSQLIEAKNRMSKPQLTAQKGAINPKKITTEPGLVIEYEMGYDPPQPLPLQNLPPYVTEEISRLLEDMADISGQHEVSNGSTPPGVTAATAISFLQEQDETLIAANYSSIEEGIEKVASQTLIYVKMFWDEERTVKIVGLDGSFDVQTFKAADLHDNTDIRIEAGSALPTSRAAKQAFLLDLMKMGFIPPEKGLEMMEIGGINRIYEEVQIDRRQAQRENLRMRVVTPEDMQMHMEAWMQENPELTKDVDSGLKLQPPPIIPVNTWDNHEIHIEVHNNYRKSQAFEVAPSEVKALFEDHVRMHQEAMAGLMTHPLTGLEDSNPNSPPMGEEEEIEDDMMEEEGSGQSTGPVPMPGSEGEEEMM